MSAVRLDPPMLTVCAADELPASALKDREEGEIVSVGTGTLPVVVAKTLRSSIRQLAVFFEALPAPL